MNVRPQLDDHSQLLHRILSDQSELRDLIQIRTALDDRGQPTERTEDHLLRSSRSVVGIRAYIRNTDRFPCSLGCKCACHQIRYFNTSRLLHKILGTFLIGYSGNPRFRNCTETNCSARSVALVRVDYIFPSWFLAQAVNLVLTSAAYGDLQMALTVRRIVPFEAEVFPLARADDVEGLQRLFATRLASPNDSDPYGTTVLHVSLSYRLSLVYQKLKREFRE